MKRVYPSLLSTAVLASLFVAESVLAQTAPADKKATGAPAATETAEEPPSKERCIESHRESQQGQREGRLLAARELAKVCTNLTCPGLLVSDCARWLTDLEQRIPSVVFEVRLDGTPNGDATITADGKPVTSWTSGESLRLDPGKHSFRFELPNHEPVEQSIFLGEGMRFKTVSAEFRSPTKPSDAAGANGAAAQPLTVPPPLPKERPTPVIVYPLLGVGALGAIGFGTFAILGTLKENDLKGTNGCSPNCTDSEMKSMKRNYLIADISMGVGAASLIAAGIFYFTRPEKESVPAVAVVPVPGGAAGFIGYQF